MRPSRLLPPAAALVTAVVATGAVLATWYGRRVYRFRDPVRIVDAAADVVLSPADGLVGFVRRIQDGQVRAATGRIRLRDVLECPRSESGTDDGWLLGIFVGPLDVHYAYQPVGGKVTAVAQRGSRANVPLLSAAGMIGVLGGQPPELLHTRATLENERLSVTIHGELGEITVALVGPGSGLDAAPYLQEGDQGRAGHKLAFLPEGGLVLLHLPDTLVPQVSVGDRVRGTQTVLARTEMVQG